MAPGDEAIFEELKQLFPILMGWVPAPAGTKREEQGGLSYLALDRSEQARYDLAQSVLLFNVSGEFSDATLLDSALYSVPCIGTNLSAVQQTLWPELAVDSNAEAVRMARILLTNAARMRSLAARGRANCQLKYGLSEEDAATWLRQLHATRSSHTMTGSR
jgi:hypothetical protein